MKHLFKRCVSWVKQHSLILKLIFFGSILVFVVNQIAHIAHGMSWNEVFEVMGQQSRWSIMEMVVAGLLCILPMLGYDYVTIRTLEKQGQEKMPRKDWFVSAWVTNTINNLAGFGGIVGASLRGTFYSKGAEKKKVLATVSKVAIFMLSGLSVLAFAALTDIFFIHRQGLYQQYWIWLLGGTLFAPVLLLFVYLNRKRLFSDLYPKGAAGLFLSSIGHWSGALLIFLVIGHVMGVPLPLAKIYPMFIIATLIGMLTMVPGGMGTFDILIILGLGHQGLDQNTVVVWLLYYRLFYYVVPFLTGLFLFIRRTGMRINRFLDNLPRLFSQKTAHLILVAAVYFAGIMMVLLSTITNLSNLSRLFDFLLPFSFDFLDQMVNMLVGFLLLGLARGLWMKVKRAFWPTILLLGFGIVNTILRTTSTRLLVTYLVIILIVWFSRKEFYREKLVYSWGALLFDGVLFGLLFISYAVAGYYNNGFLHDRLITNRFIFFPSEEVWFSGLIGIGISLIALVSLYQYLASSMDTIGSELDLPRLTALLEKYEGTSTSHYLTLPGYQYYYYRVEGRDVMAFGYQIKANKFFVLGDPIGDKEKWKEATQDFMAEADRLGYQLAFYKVSEAYILLLHDLGYEFAKVGESGVVNLQPRGRAGFSERIEFKKLQNEGYQFTYFAELPEEFLQDCREISEEWLAGEKEKQFSVGRFEEDYLTSSGVGVALNSKGEAAGFITQQPIDKESVSFDLLRTRKDAPAMLSNFLIASLLDEYSRQGYQIANIGLAPLARVGDSSFSFWGEKLMNVIYRYGNRFYEFQTTQQSKEPYADAWQARYFAYRKNSGFVIAAVQLLLLIGKGKAKGPTLAEEVMMRV